MSHPWGYLCTSAWNFVCVRGLWCFWGERVFLMCGCVCEARISGMLRSHHLLSQRCENIQKYLRAFSTPQQRFTLWLWKLLRLKCTSWIFACLSLLCQSLPQMDSTKQPVVSPCFLKTAVWWEPWTSRSLPGLLALPVFNWRGLTSCPLYPTLPLASRSWW